MSFKVAAPYREIALNRFGGLYAQADPRDLPPGASPLCYDVDFLIASVRMRPGQSSVTTTPVGLVQYIKRTQLVDNMTLVQAGANLYIEDVDTAPGTFTNIYSSILGGARALSDNAFGREFIGLSDFNKGTDQPRHYDGTNLDRISQVGPGVSPIPVVTTQASNVYPIARIDEAWPSAAIWRMDWSSNFWAGHDGGPGTAVTIFNSDGAVSQTWAQIKVGDIIFIGNAPLIGTNLPDNQGANPNGTYVVTAVGVWQGAGGQDQYIQVQAETAQNKLGPTNIGVTFGATFQRTQALVTTTNPIPIDQAHVGSKLVISGASVAAWNGVYNIVGTPTEGQLLITTTVLTGNVATYGYSPVNGQAPGWQPSVTEVVGSQIVDAGSRVWTVTVPGLTGGTRPAFPASPAGGATITDNQVTWVYQTNRQMLVTVFNTSNGNGVFNVQNAVITSATTNTFTIALTSVDIVSSGETGEAISGQGTLFLIDPGQNTLGTGHPGVNPIFGAATGGVAVTSNPNVAAGQRYVTSMYLTRSGFISPPSPPRLFFTDASESTIQFTKLPIGTSNVVARIVAMTAANAGIGGPYYYVPQDVVIPASVLTLGKQLTINKTVVPDNTSTSSAVLTLSDAVLLASVNITTKGNNVFQQRELGACVKPVQYTGRLFYSGERVKVDKFINMTFDGGYVTANAPSGWTQDQGLASQVTIGNSSLFGFNLAIIGNARLKQTAFQDVFNTAIIQPVTAYSVRVVASGSGSLVVDLFDGTTSYAFTTPALTGSPVEYSGAFSNPLWQPVPSGLVLRFYMSGGTGNATIERIEVFPTKQPNYDQQIIGSYALNPEAVDSITGVLNLAALTNQKIRSYYRFLDTLYISTDNRTFAVQGTNDEPSGWGIREISNSVGAIGPAAIDVGEEYVLHADRRGVFIFDGGTHIKLSQDIQQVWDAIYWPSANQIWVRNDLRQQRFLIGIPLPTPNQWLPNAATNATPTTPNVILMCSYLGTTSKHQIGGEPPIHPSVFTGNLLWLDMRRKWSPWQIASPWGEWILRNDGSEAFWLGAASAINKLDSTIFNDVGSVIVPVYTTYGFSDQLHEEGLQIGSTRKLYSYLTTNIEGAGKFKITALPESVATSFTDSQPAFALSSPAVEDVNVPLNVAGNRAFFQFTTDSVLNSHFEIKRVVVAMILHPKIPVAGI